MHSKLATNSQCIVSICMYDVIMYHVNNKNNSEWSEVSIRAWELFRMASRGVCFACVKIFFLALFGGLGHIAKCFWVISRGIPQDGHARPTNSTVLLDCAYRANQCSRGQKWSHLLDPKLFVLSLMVKILLPLGCQLVYSWLHCLTIDDLLWLQHRPNAPFPCHMIYMYT